MRGAWAPTALIVLAASLVLSACASTPKPVARHGTPHGKPPAVAKPPVERPRAEHPDVETPPPPVTGPPPRPPAHAPLTAGRGAFRPGP